MPKHLKRNEINLKKWDQCILQSPNESVYAISWYLDAVTEQKWTALVWGDYDVVMPLPYNYKLVVLRQVYTPQPCKILGLYGQQVTANHIQQARKYLNKYIQYVYNSEQFGEKSRANAILDLSKPYELLRKNYRSDRVKDLKKTKELIYKPINVSEYLDYFFTVSAKTLQEIGADTKEFERVYRKADKKNATALLCAMKDEKILSVIGCIKWNNTFYVLSSATSEEGYKKRAFVGLVDFIIQQNANSNATIDFMGSSIKGIMAFNQSFGAVKEEYFQDQKINKLVALVKEIRKK